MSSVSSVSSISAISGNHGPGQVSRETATSLHGIFWKDKMALNNLGVVRLITMQMAQSGFFCAESILFLAKKMRDKEVLAF